MAPQLMALALDSNKNMPQGKTFTTLFRKFPKQKEPTAGCFMVQRFSCYSKLCSFFGCFFIRGLRYTSVDQARATWRSMYTLYAAGWIALFLGVEVWYKFLAHYRQRSGTNSDFTMLLYGTVYLCSLFTGIANILCMLFGSSRLLVFFQKAALFEESNDLSDLFRRRSFGGSWFQTIRKAGVAVSVITSFSFCVGFVVDEYSPRNQIPEGFFLFVLFLRLVILAAFVFYECIMYVVMSTLCDVLVIYIRSQEPLLLDCQQKVLLERTNCQTAGLAVEKVRTNLSTIRELKSTINAIWSPAIMISSVCFLWIQCMTWYCFFIDEKYQLFLWFGFAYSSYFTLSILDLTMISHNLYREVRTIKDMAKCAVITQADKAYAWQIQFLHSSIEPEGMLLTGAEFFNLDRGLLVSMAGSIITYTVILVQTSNSLASRSSGCPGGVT